ncbi:hypothetical protein BN2497_9959 [Janthinobacterium sp. CG23_2]|nr:hypothetical protein BN2497_9959 [Janthinobacterium sp. CG23_2]CUU31377.1 hypothetical protein BN3177_9959 [Janthinobacterium sp. CG23_2]
MDDNQDGFASFDRLFVVAPPAPPAQICNKVQREGYGFPP